MKRERVIGKAGMYADLLFVLNFMMDTMVLLASVHLLGAALTVPLKRLFLGAAAGALGGCIFTFMGQAGMLDEGPEALAAGLGLCILMVGIVFAPRSAGGWVQKVLTVYGAAFLLGGMLKWVQESLDRRGYYGAVGLCFVFSVAGGFLYRRTKLRTQTYCTARLGMEGKTVCVKGLMDTGNLLTLPGTGIPVSVVWEEAALEGMTPLQRRQYEEIKETNVLPEENADGWYMIPYHTVGRQGGLLPVLTISRMYLQTEPREVLIAKPRLGICPHPLSASGAYQMILSPKLMEQAR